MSSDETSVKDDDDSLLVTLTVRGADDAFKGAIAVVGLVEEGVVVVIALSLSRGSTGGYTSQRNKGEMGKKKCERPFIVRSSSLL